MIQFKNLYQIKDYYDRLCDSLGMIAPQVDFLPVSREYRELGVCRMDGRIEFCSHLFYLTDNDIQDQYRAFWSLPENKLSATDYVVYHEIYHHITGLPDGINFEYQLWKWISNHKYNR